MPKYMNIRKSKELYADLSSIPMPQDYDIQRAKIAALTCKTLQEFSEFLDLNPLVIKYWCHMSASFKKAYDSWKDNTTAEIEVALAKKAVGFKKTVKRDVLTKAGTIETLEIETYYPPDPTAAQFWLKNRAPEDWKDKSEVDVNVNANIRAWLIAAGEEVPEVIEGQHKILEGSNELIENSCSVGMTEGSDPLIEANNLEPLNVINNDTESLNASKPLNVSMIDEPLNTTDHTPLNITPAVIEQEPVAKVQTNAVPKPTVSPEQKANWSLFSDE